MLKDGKEALYDSASRGLYEGKFVYLSILEIDGAFDAIPHKLFLESLRKIGVERYIIRYEQDLPGQIKDSGRTFF